ncbi:MAG TPA: NAD-dependent epimerase/dehydratase family protein, partial [Paracoccaceae bacterium]|nr:NAD-dependent epimerase/dehydratase family protein [Paracoccaceae bacterium]
MAPLLVLGATGRIGIALRQVWGPDAAIWQARAPRAGFVAWDILADPAPAGVASGVVLLLAGGRSAAGQDAALARATLRAAQAQGARWVFLASSAAVYGPGEGLAESASAAPVSAYGEAKRAMEMAAHDVRGVPVTLLRIGNVVGADGLIGAAMPGQPVLLDRAEGRP